MSLHQKMPRGRKFSSDKHVSLKFNYVFKGAYILFFTQKLYNVEDDLAYIMADLETEFYYNFL